jgi:hypothetical protein
VNAFDPFERIFLLFLDFDNSIFNLIVGNETSSVPTEYGDFAGLGEFAAQGLF